MRHGPIAAVSVAVLALAGCTAGDPPSGERHTLTSATPSGVGPRPTDPTGTDLTATAGPGSTTDPGTGPEDPERQALLDIARAEDTVSVIVEVPLDGDAERGSDRHARLVAEAQDALEAELDPEHARVTTRFDDDARLTLTVDETGLRALFASPHVRNIWENRTVPLD